jgi:pyridoxamine 5'-phosphate oxidase
VIASRAELEARYAAVDERFRGKPVPRPSDWGLYAVTPQMLEFWSSRPHRLHDRSRFRRAGDGWSFDLLSP